MNDYWIEVDGIPQPATLLEWANWFEKADRHVLLTHLTPEIYVSTVFIGLNHNWGSGPSLLYETMIFGGALDNKQWRYSTRKDAITGHAAAVRAARRVSE